MKFNSTPTVDGGALPSLPRATFSLPIDRPVFGGGNLLTPRKPQSGLFWIEGEENSATVTGLLFRFDGSECVAGSLVGQLP